MAKRLKYTDINGLHWMVELPDDVPDDEASMGVRIGPPDLSGLGFPQETMKRLHNQLFDRGLITAEDVQKQASSVFGAIQTAYRADVVAVMNLYLEENQDE
jgi:hypothetical protein